MKEIEYKSITRIEKETTKVHCNFCGCYCLKNYTEVNFHGPWITNYNQAGLDAFSIEICNECLEYLHNNLVINPEYY